MIQLGLINTVKIVQKTLTGYLYSDKENHEVMIQFPVMREKEFETGSMQEVFIYKDSEGNYVGSLDKPFIQLGEFAFLKVRDLNDTGAFMDWGMPKDLLVPFRHQNQKMQAGRRYIVYLLIDALTDRLIGTSKIDKFLDNDQLSVEEGDEVNLLVYEKTDLGYNVIINHRHKGLVYANEVFTTLEVGDTIKGFIKTIRPDHKIDVMLQRHGFEATEPIRELILEKLQLNSGFLPLTDKSEPESIYASFGVSKKVFKKAIGGLYKEKLIALKEDGIYLL